MSVRTDDFEPVLAALAAGAQQYFGDAGAIVEPVARFERKFSALLRLRVKAGGRDSHAFAKVFKPRFSTPEELAALRRWVEREFSASKRLHEALHPQQGLSTLRPVAVFPDDLAIVTEEVVGTTFERMLRDALWGRRVAAPPDLVAERIGAWIRTYQTVIEAEGVLDLSERREYLDVRLNRLAAAGAFSDADAAAVHEKFDALRSEIGTGVQPLVAIHADLNPGNILVSDGGDVTVLDFSMAKVGARFHDLSHLYMHLEFVRWRPRLKAGIISAAQTALLRGYDPASSPSDPLFQLLLLQHLVCHVALLAERPSGPLDPAVRWFVRRRWAKCARLLGIGAGGRLSRLTAGLFF